MVSKIFSYKCVYKIGISCDRIEIADYGFADGERFAFFETENGLIFASDAYNSIADATTLDEIEDYIESMLANLSVLVRIKWIFSFRYFTADGSSISTAPNAGIYTSVSGAIFCHYKKLKCEEKKGNFTFLDEVLMISPR